MNNSRSRDHNRSADSSRNHGRSRTKDYGLPTKDHKAREPSHRSIDVDDVSFEGPKEQGSQGALERTRSPRRGEKNKETKEVSIQQDKAAVEHKERKLDQPSIEQPPAKTSKRSEHPDARSSWERGPQLPVKDDDGQPEDAAASAQPTVPTTEQAPAVKPEEIPIPDSSSGIPAISLNDESTLKCQDPDEKIEYFGSYHTVTEVLRHKRETKLFTTNLSEELDNDYQKACKAMHKEYYNARSAAMKSENIYKNCQWSKSESHFVIPGPKHGANCFYMDVLTGKCFDAAYHTQDDLTEEQAIKHWTEAEEANRKETKQFLDEHVFRKKYFMDINIEAIHAIWVRKWKQLADGTIIVKSRLCVRRFLDPQQSRTPTRSTTASRLSHRLFMSLCALLDFEIESWDLSGAFLKGFTFHQLDELYKKLGIVAPKREVVIKPPANVWRHLRRIENSKIYVVDAEIWFYFLELVKPAYGLNDAPYAFQACEGAFFVEDLKALRSAFDENF